MCQLTVANLNNTEYNRLYLAVQMTLNSKDHQDGAGFWNGVKYYKQKTMPRLNYNFGTNLSAIITTPYPAFGHVRKASLIKGQKIVSPENSHPFVGERFILAHNGTLDPKEYKMWSEFPTVEIDTALFASFLEKNAKQNPDKLFLDLLKSTYNDFSGKFAFIITDRKTDTNYIIRGFTASLFKYDVEICRKKKDGSEEVINTGFVINTEKDDLQAGIILFSNLLQTIYGVYVKYDDARFSELEKETAFKLSGNTLEKIGEIKETYKTYSTVPVKVEKIDDVEYEVAQKAKEFCETWGISLVYFEEIVHLYLEKGLVELTKEDVENLPKILEKIESTLSGGKKKIRATWTEILKKLGDEWIPHTSGGIVFPYMSEELKNLKTYLESL